MGALARIVQLAAEAPDLTALTALRLSAAVAASCGAVASLAAECEESQRVLLGQGDLVPALFRLASCDEAAVATQAARCARGLHSKLSGGAGRGMGQGCWGMRDVTAPAPPT